MSDRSDQNQTIIKVNISDAYASSTMLKAVSETTAGELCTVISHKLALRSSELPYYYLVLVYTVIGRNGRKYHTVKSLESEDFVLAVLKRVSDVQCTKHNVEKFNLTTTANWYYKDLMSRPLDLEFDPDDDFSGNSSSDDEEEISLNDVSYLRQNDRKGFMLKKSKKDPHLWRKRYCVLTDKLWCIDAKRTIPRASSIKINAGQAKLLEYNPTDVNTIPNSFSIRFNDSARITTYHFRVQTEGSLASWVEEVKLRISLNKDNETILLGEQIICDEEYNRNQRTKKAVNDVLSVIAISAHRRAVQQKFNGNEVFAIGVFSKLHRAHHWFPRNAEILAFLLAVRRYKEYCRHDLKHSVPQRWEKICEIYNLFLVKQLYLLNERLSVQEDDIFDENFSLERISTVSVARTPTTASASSTSVGSEERKLTKQNSLRDRSKSEKGENWYLGKHLGFRRSKSMSVIESSSESSEEESKEAPVVDEKMYNVWYPGKHLGLRRRQLSPQKQGSNTANSSTASTSPDRQGFLRRKLKSFRTFRRARTENDDDGYNFEYRDSVAFSEASGGDSAAWGFIDKSVLENVLLILMAHLEPVDVNSKSSTEKCKGSGKYRNENINIRLADEAAKNANNYWLWPNSPQPNKDVTPPPSSVKRVNDRESENVVSCEGHGLVKVVPFISILDLDLATHHIKDLTAEPPINIFDNIVEQLTNHVLKGKK